MHLTPTSSRGRFAIRVFRQTVLELFVSLIVRRATLGTVHHVLMLRCKGAPIRRRAPRPDKFIRVRKVRALVPREIRIEGFQDQAVYDRHPVWLEWNMMHLAVPGLIRRSVTDTR